MSRPKVPRIRRWAALTLAAAAMAACADNSLTDGGNANGEHPPTSPAPAIHAPSFSVTGTEETFTQTISSGSRFGQYTDQDFGWTHTFPLWNTPGLIITSAKLIVQAYDVDAEPAHGYNGEYDAVTIDGMALNPGYLQGSNSVWSTTTFDIPVETITDDGVLNTFLNIDIHNTRLWLTQLSSSELVITYSIGPVNGAPYAPTLSGTPSGNVEKNQDMTVNVTGPTPADPDGDAVTYEYRWFLDTGTGGFLDPSIHGRGTFTTNTVPSSATQLGDHWRVQVTPRDANGAIGPQAIFTFGAVVPVSDVTPPEITPTVTGTAGTNGWYTSDVHVTWAVTDAQSAITNKTGCDDVTIDQNTAGQTITCTATSTGGTASQHVTIKRDATAPTITGSATGPSSNGWFTGDVSISFTASDDISSVSSTAGCAASQITDTPGATFPCTVTNDAGLSASASVSVKRDATNPLVAIVGNAGTYTAEQTVNITCSISDAMSGVASQSCNGASGDAFSLGLGTHALSASATDAAGNTASATGSYTVNATFGSTCALVQRWLTKPALGNAFCQELDNAAAAAARGQSNASDNVLDAFINHVQAQTGKSLSEAHAAVLITLANALK
jgi:hypothetical protein